MQMNYDPELYGRALTSYSCKVVGFYNQTYGKMPSGDISYIHIGFEDWIAKMASETTFSTSYDQGAVQTLKEYL